MLEGSHGQRVEVWLRRNDERTGVSRVTSSHFFFAVAAPNLYVPPVFAIESTIFIQAVMSSPKGRAFPHHSSEPRLPHRNNYRSRREC